MASTSQERILEYLGVQQRVDKVKGRFSAWWGRPAWAKTSLVQRSRAGDNRKFVRMALAGWRDESEIRGHRRTYIGSMPARSCKV